MVSSAFKQETFHDARSIGIRTLRSDKLRANNLLLRHLSLSCSSIDLTGLGHCASNSVSRARPHDQSIMVAGRSVIELQAHWQCCRLKMSILSDVLLIAHVGSWGRILRSKVFLLSHLKFRRRLAGHVSCASSWLYRLISSLGKSGQVQQRNRLREIGLPKPATVLATWLLASKLCLIHDSWGKGSEC